MRRNSLLAAVEPEHLALAAARAAIVRLEAGVCFQDPGEPVEQVYFPVTSVFAFGAGTREGDIVHVGLVGAEGGFGMIEACGSRHAHALGQVIVGGDAVRLSAAAFRQLFDASAGLRSAIHRHLEASLVEARQSIACNALHTVEMRLAKILLSLSDHVGEPIPITQEALSLLLGVQRTTVAAAMSALNRKGAVRSRRGTVHVLDGPRLERASCTCRQTLADALREIQSSRAPVCDA